jgi:hypothetical protein
MQSAMQARTPITINAIVPLDKENAGAVKLLKPDEE